MNYRHAYHAGNFADVFKHIILARLVTYMKGKEKAFRVYDTHAGLGRYDLASVEAGKTGEAELGVAKVLAATTSPAVAEIIAPWKEAVAASPEGTYPGSPAIARHLLRKQDRLTLYELHEEDHPVLAANFAGDYQTRVQLSTVGSLPVPTHRRKKPAASCSSTHPSKTATISTV